MEKAREKLQTKLDKVDAWLGKTGETTNQNTLAMVGVGMLIGSVLTSWLS